MVASGFYFSPGYDCQTEWGSAKVLFTATVEEDSFAIFSKAPISLEASASGYGVSRISKIWTAGQSLDCETISLNGSETKVAVFVWTFDTGPGEGPSHLSFVVAKNKKGLAEIVSCEWSYGKPEIFLTDQGLVARYAPENGATQEVYAVREDPLC